MTRWVTERLRLLGWSALLGCSAVLTAIAFGFALLVSVALIPAGVGVPMTDWLLERLRGLADLHRLWAIGVMDTRIPRPYRTYHALTRSARLAEVRSDPATWRDLRWLPVNHFAGPVLAGLPAALGLMSAATIAAFLERRSERSTPWEVTIPSRPPGFADIYAPAAQTSDKIWLLIVAAVVLFLLMWLVTKPAMRVYARFLSWSLGPAESTRLAGRIDELTQTRAETLDTQAAEIRRIERDLHDGAQARLVSLGMSLGMAEKLLVADPAAALQLVAEAKQSTGHALSELRQLVHGIHPPILADRGLDGAAHALALASPLPVTVTVDMDGRPPAPVESAVYFALTETLTNVTKHSAATTAWVRITHQHGMLSVMVADNGLGGATCTPGGGLHGIERRLAAFDGTVTVTSPAGGPTIVTLEVPCEPTCGSS
ncbi:MAG TPA: histidine kinase [Pseudonocardiaceae bacterium]|nr:histidine kinase [Pseudonocardiaceae bacterium]